MVFTCQHVSKAYLTRTGTVYALENVTFSVEEREFVCIVGPSGCGKTTLLKLIAGLIEPTTGKIILHSNSHHQQLNSALVFQEHGLFPWMTVLDNVAFGLETQGIGQRERKNRAMAFIERVGLAAFANNYPRELSVGMRQRVGIARAFVANPRILLMDEPFASLDAQTKLVLQDELLRIWKDHQKSVVYITHDIEEAIRLGDRVLVMTGHPGRIRAEIPVSLDRPRTSSVNTDAKVTEIKWHIWKMLEEEVRQNLAIAG